MKLEISQGGPYFVPPSWPEVLSVGCWLVFMVFCVVVFIWAVRNDTKGPLD